MSLSKRLFDVICGVGLGVILLPVIAVVAIVVLALDGRPVLYISERMRGPKTPFDLIKFRTMKASDVNAGVSGGDKSDRITRTGTFLRRTRIDELPQIWNVLRGDISFVGPRPPLRLYVEQFPELYVQVLQSRPGVTGLASVYFHRHEEYLLADCDTAGQTRSMLAAVSRAKRTSICCIRRINRSVWIFRSCLNQSLNLCARG